MTGLTLLCVDDDAATRELYRTLFTTYGYDVVVAEDGHQALKTFSTHDIGAAIVDYEMPGLRGSELAAAIKRNNPDVPVLIVSGCQSIVEDAPRFVDAALPKGTPISGLVEKVEALLNGCSSREFHVR